MVASLPLAIGTNAASRNSSSLDLGNVMQILISYSTRHSDRFQRNSQKVPKRGVQ